jgi:hypothetical protein
MTWNLKRKKKKKSLTWTGNDFVGHLNDAQTGEWPKNKT